MLCFPEKSEDCRRFCYIFGGNMTCDVFPGTLKNTKGKSLSMSHASQHYSYCCQYIDKYQCIVVSLIH